MDEEKVRQIIRAELSAFKKELLDDLKPTSGSRPTDSIVSKKEPMADGSSQPAGQTAGKPGGYIALTASGDQPLIGDAETPPTWAEKVQSSLPFEMYSVFLVISNAIWIGVQTQYAAVTWSSDAPEWFDNVDRAYCVCFVTEVSIKMLAQRQNFFLGEEWKWNIFDLFATGTQVSEVLLSVEGGRFGQVMRILRLMRLVRVARIANVVPELKKLVSSVTTSLLPLTWTLVLVFLLNYAFSIMVTQVVNDHKIRHGKEAMEEQEELLEFFGSMDTTFISLYMVISEGIHWCELAAPLAKFISPWTKPVVCLFVAFQLFAMMNVITAYFVEAAFKAAAQNEKDEMAHELWEMFEKDLQLAAPPGRKLKKNDFVVTRDIFVKFKDHPKMAEFIDMLGVDPEEGEILWDLIDENGLGRLSADQFFHGCTKLVGSARAELIWRLSFEFKQAQKEALRNHQELLGVAKAISVSCEKITKATSK
eukprot:TRINITY_DN8835_c0_g1_i1.p1 TRINITY_DN8835_c0_g1~~TRINITY_DN8835_c0_g1_i1.p1  ORF type:complete len:477 (+),score=126.75 TRINITY_DN8835_c0_g1_i1:64-1494(+)